MIDCAFLARIKIEPLDRDKHDRAAFSCGEDRIDNFLKYSASGQQGQDLTRICVACLDNTPVVVGYYALNNHSVNVATLPEQIRKRLPKYETIGAIYLSIVAVHSDHQNRGLGENLMAHALARCVDVADLVGAHFVVLDALNERSARLYKRLGFEDLPGHSPRMLIAMKMVRKAVAKANEREAKAT
jgi:ribosomal protein S18 acetylase RimI-like enzyme